MNIHLRRLINHFPWLKSLLKRGFLVIFPQRGVSTDYVEIARSELDSESVRLSAAWKDDGIPFKQRELVDQQLCQFRHGARIDVFDVFVDSLRTLRDLEHDASLLEVGCSSGYYSEVVEIARLPLKYHGCDYSAAFIRMAKEYYPSKDFAVADATALHYPDGSFDVVVSGCCLLHIPDYAKGVSETARVARRYAIFHRTPVVLECPERRYRKNAYGVETVEIHFNEVELLTLFEKSGLERLATYTIAEGVEFASGSARHAVRTYVCGKKEQ